MKLQLKALSLALGASALMAGTAWGASNGATAPTGPLTASVPLNLTIIVPKILLLRVGQQSATDNLSWQAAFSPNVSMNNWDGLVPGTSFSSSPSAITTYMWTNVSGPTVLTCSTGVGFTPGGGPTMSDITVKSSAAANGGVNHPATTNGGGAVDLTTACAGTTSMPRSASVRTSSWLFEIDPITIPSFVSGTHTGTVTYTATTP